MNSDLCILLMECAVISSFSTFPNVKRPSCSLFIYTSFFTTLILGSILKARFKTRLLACFNIVVHLSSFLHINGCIRVR